MFVKQFETRSMGIVLKQFLNRLTSLLSDLIKEDVVIVVSSCNGRVRI
jgi:hypothetical protein